ncbi:MAG: LamG-like jellyroll fold domain-containing protein [Sulfolobales archaeon]
MPLTRSRLLPVSRSCLFFDGVSQYAVVGIQPDGSGKPFTVYGWSEISVEYLVYPVSPKALEGYRSLAFIGDVWDSKVSISTYSDYPTNYSQYWITFDARAPDGSLVRYQYAVSGLVNTWAHVATTFSADRTVRHYVNASRVYSATVPSNYVTVLEQNPDQAPVPARLKRFTLGASTYIGGYMTVKIGYARIYSRALTDEEILWNFYYPDNPVRNGLVLWLHWDSIDTAAGKWYDKSGFGNHATLYNNPVKEDVLLPPKRVLSPTRTLTPVR